MQTVVRINEKELTQVFTAYIERRLRFGLGRFGTRVGQVTVRVAVEEIDPDLFLAIDRAAGRIGRLFGRELERGRDSRIGRDSVRIAV
jgi:hypothetical protein